MKIGVFHPPLGIKLIDNLMEFVISGFKIHEPDCFIHRGNDYVECDVAIRWGMHSLRYPETTQYRNNIDKAHKGPIGVIELGWINRKNYFQFGFGGISGVADYFNMDGFNNQDRFDTMYTSGVLSERTKTPNDYVLICGQVPWDTSVQHIDYEKWLHETLRELGRITKLPLVFRPHPLHPAAIDTEKLPCVDVISNSRIKTLEHDLHHARCVVTYNSNSALEALIKGVPVITMHRGSMVYPITLHSLDRVENPFMPVIDIVQERITQILNCQWSYSEFIENIPWQKARGQIIERYVHK